MPAFFFVIGKTSNITTREYSDHLKSSVLSPDSFSKIGAIELASSMKLIIMDSLDSLLQIIDDMQKLDMDIEGFIKNMEKRYKELEGGKDELKMKNNRGTFPIKDYLLSFDWDSNKFPKDHNTLNYITSKIVEKFETTKISFKSQNDEFIADNEKLKQIMKSDSEAALMMKTDYRITVSKCLSEMITTDYLTTVLCFIPIQQEKQFLDNYMNYSKYVMDDSALKLNIKSDEEKVSLYRVIVLSDKKDEFINQCRISLRIYCKEFNREEIMNMSIEQKTKDELQANIKAKKQKFKMSLESQFSEMFSTLMHLKILRLYCEATLKYGTNEYYCINILANQGKEAKVVSQMIKCTSDVGDPSWYGTKEEIKDTEDFYPFILIKLGVPSTI